MTTESLTGFHHGDSLGSIMNRHAVSFQSAINSSSEMIPMGGCFAPQPVILPANSSIFTTSPALIQAGNTSGSSLPDSVAGLKHDIGFAVEWSVDEQYLLEDGLDKYKEEPNIMKYIKIAATFPDKTVRDVALRCRWMQQRKRKKPEEPNAGKKVNNKKDKLVESPSKMNMPTALPQNMAAYPFMMQHLDHNKRMPSEGISGTILHLLKQNAQAFSQISSNLSVYKLQDNIDLFCHARNNITAILNDMRDMPGLMSQMLPLPVSVNEDLANSILPGATQSMIFGLASSIHLKQEPSC